MADDMTVFKSLSIVNATGAIITRRVWPSFERLNLYNGNHFDLPTIGDSNNRIVIPFASHADIVEVVGTYTLPVVRLATRLEYGKTVDTFTSIQTEATSNYVYATTRSSLHRYDVTGMTHSQTNMSTTNISRFESLAFHRDYLLVSGSTTLEAMGLLPVEVVGKFDMQTIRRWQLSWPKDYVSRVYNSISLLVSPLNNSHLIVVDRQTIRGYAIDKDSTTAVSVTQFELANNEQYIRSVKFVSGTTFIVVDIDRLTVVTRLLQT